MRLVLVEPVSVRGEGLGNEVIGWAKGFLASRVLNATLIDPAWGANPRGYWRNFRSSRLDVLRNLALRGLPRLRFTEADYWATGRVDFGLAIEQWASQHHLQQRRHLLVSVGGMYGGYRAIRRAAPFLRSQLLASKQALANIEAVSRVLDRGKLSVAVHVRLGDFTSHVEGERRGQFNFRLPIEWYASACQAVRAEFGGDVQFLFFSDQKSPQFLALSRQFDAVALPRATLPECSDVILMADADLRICSVSSYSLFACFLSDGPYLWYEPQLLRADGRYRIWDDPATVAPREQAAKDTTAALDAPGYAHMTGAMLPPSLIVQLRRRLAARDARRNLLEFGSIAASPSPTASSS